MEAAISQVVETVENQLDQQIDQLRNLSVDDLETIRNQRLKLLKEKAAQQIEWKKKVSFTLFYFYLLQLNLYKYFNKLFWLTYSRSPVIRQMLEQCRIIKY